MSAVQIDAEGFVVDAEDLARAFGVTPETILEELRAGRLTSRSEKGVDEHEGSHRLIFSYQGRRLRLTLDGSGRVVSRVVFAPPPAPPSSG